MPDWLQAVIAILGAGGLISGLAAYRRARGQNRVDERAQLSAEQVAFRAEMRQELTTLRAAIGQLETERAELNKINREQFDTITRLQVKQEDLTADNAELKTRVIDLQAVQATQAADLARVTEERAQLNQKLLVAESLRTFLERENSQLRTENSRLRELLPPRILATEVSDVGEQPAESGEQRPS